MRLDNPKQVREFLREAQEAAKSVKGELERRVTADLSYYAGKQWIRSGTVRTFDMSGNTVYRLPTDFSPDAKQLRVTTNRVAPLIQKSVATTFPDRIDADFVPPEADLGIEAVFVAGTLQKTLGVAMDASRYHGAAMDVNFHRALWGSYGILFTLLAKLRPVKVGDAELVLPDTEIQACAFAPTDLTLDPDNSSRDLEQHEYVIHSSAWTVNKIRRRLGDDALKGIEVGDLLTMGELAKFQYACNHITDGQLFAQYKGHSTTKGAMVHQIHRKDDYGRFSEMYVVIEYGGEVEPRVLNADNPESPFGGIGLPMFLFHAHRRTDGPWGLSDGSMLKDDQDKLNLGETQKHRILQAYSHHKYAIDRNTIGRESSEEAYAKMVTNAIGGPLFYTSGDRTRPGNPPQLLQPPQPPSILMEITRQYEDAMRGQVHRADVNMGAVKSHVPDKSFKEAIEQSDQVLGTRVREDVLTHNRALTVLLGTMVKNVQKGSPCTLAMLRRALFTPDRLAVLAETDPHHLPGTVQIRESSVRFRSQNAKRDDLNLALERRAISATEYRAALASDDIDTPLTADDRFYSQQAERAAMRVMRGEEWEPVPLGEYSHLFVNAFRKALLGVSDMGGNTPPARQRLMRAIESQEMVELQRAAMQTVAQSPPVGGASGQPAQQVQEQSVLDILASLEQGGGAGVGSQPTLMA